MTKLKAVILNTDACVRAFKQAMYARPALRAYFLNQPRELQEFLAIMVQYMADQDTAYACLQEFALEIKEVFCSEFSEEDLEALSQASLELALQILNQFNMTGLYKAAGTHWWRVVGLIGNDLHVQYDTNI